MPTTSENCSPKSVLEIRADAIRLRLDGYDRVARLTVERLASVYNGCGPEFLPDAARKALDRFTTVFAPAVMVHDVDFAASDGRQRAFQAANDRLLRNCIACAEDAEPWHSWRRYALVFEAFLLYRACVKFGWMAWLSAYNKRKGKNNENQ